MIDARVGNSWAASEAVGGISDAKGRETATVEGSRLETDTIAEANAVVIVVKVEQASITALAIPSSVLPNRSTSSLKLGINRVHQNAIRSPRSTTRCFRINRTTRIKKAKPERIRMRSSQSDFSSAVTRCLEVDITVFRVSCCRDVERRVAVDSSRSCVLSTERSSSDCMRDMVRRSASVTSEFACISASSLWIREYVIQ